MQKIFLKKKKEKRQYSDKSRQMIPNVLTGTCPLMMTSSAKRTLTGFVFNLAFFAALMNADLGDFRGRRKKRKRKRKAVN